MQENVAYNLTVKAEEKPEQELPDFGNLVNFFSLLQKVDMRNNPQNYQPKQVETNDRHSNPDTT